MSFAVLEGFRGVTASTIDVSTGPGGHAAASRFSVGTEYIVYADGRVTAGLAGSTTSRCSGTRDVEDAGADLAYARDVKQGKAPAGHIGGRVLPRAARPAGKTTGLRRSRRPTSR